MSSGCQRVLINYLQLLYREVNWFYFLGKIVRGNPWLSKKVGGYFT